MSHPRPLTDSGPAPADVASRLDRLLLSRMGGVNAGLLALRLWFGGVLALSHGWTKLEAPAKFLAGPGRYSLDATLVRAGIARRVPW